MLDEANKERNMSDVKRLTYFFLFNYFIGFEDVGNSKKGTKLFETHSSLNNVNICFPILHPMHQLELSPF